MHIAVLTNRLMTELHCAAETDNSSIIHDDVHKNFGR